MSARNLIWLAVVIAAGVIGWLLGGWVTALVAAGVTLLVSEVVERRARRQRITAAADASHDTAGTVTEVT